MGDAIAPRNLTAQAASTVTGNPPNTQLESSVANCFPGLEFDIRALDRRFFPGLVFEFIPKPLSAPSALRTLLQGARLSYVDFYQDPMLPEKSEDQWVRDLRAAYGGAIATSLASGEWYLHSIDQSGIRIAMYDDKGAPLDGTVVWRFVRALEAKEVTICLASRDPDGHIDQPLITLVGQRRVYVPKSGVFDSSYRAGEFTASMCNPWTHDFRDCACHYWAASRPDVVFGPATEKEESPSPSSARQEEARFDWLRNVRGPSGDASASATLGENRPFQVDHHEINHTWEKLSFVLEGREIIADYAPPAEKVADPYANTEEMIADLQTRLAPMEMCLALEYLYALFSLRSPEETVNGRWSTLSDDLVFLRRGLIMIAASEMTHLRWANQLLWELHKACPQPNNAYVPVLHPKRKDQPKEPRRFDPPTLDNFIDVERPAGPVDTAYAKCVATLRQPRYPAELYALAVRIDSDGMEHHLRFLEMKAALESYPREPPYPYLRDVTIGSPSQTSAVMKIFDDIRKNLDAGFRAEAAGQTDVAQTSIATARALMLELRLEAEKLAMRGVGIPFFP